MKIYQKMVDDIADLDALLEELMSGSRMTPDEVEAHFQRLKVARMQKDSGDPGAGKSLPVP